MTGWVRRDLSDDELRAVARLVVRTYLEVERGQRDPRVLRRFLAPQLAFDVEQRTRRPGAPPVTAGDVGGALFNRVGVRRGYAVVTVRDADCRWRAVTVVLRRTDTGAWHVTELRRINETHIPTGDHDGVGHDDVAPDRPGGAR